MADLTALAVIVGFFALAAGFVRFCDRLTRSDAGVDEPARAAWAADAGTSPVPEVPQ